MTSVRIAVASAFVIFIVTLVGPVYGAATMRIVSLAPSVTETLFALGAGPEVVGVSQYCDYPPEVRDLPRVGSFLTPNIEAIIALRPTLVIGLGLSSDLRQIRALKSLGYKVLLVRDSSLTEIEDNIATVGAQIGREVRVQIEQAGNERLSRGFHDARAGGNGDIRPYRLDARIPYEYGGRTRRSAGAIDHARATDGDHSRLRGQGTQGKDQRKNPDHELMIAGCAGSSRSRLESVSWRPIAQLCPRFDLVHK